MWNSLLLSRRAPVYQSAASPLLYIKRDERVREMLMLSTSAMSIGNRLQETTQRVLSLSLSLGPLKYLLYNTHWMCIITALYHWTQSTAFRRSSAAAASVPLELFFTSLLCKTKLQFTVHSDIIKQIVPHLLYCTSKRWFDRLPFFADRISFEM